MRFSTTLLFTHQMLQKRMTCLSLKS